MKNENLTAKIEVKNILASSTFTPKIHVIVDEQIKQLSLKEAEELLIKLTLCINNAKVERSICKALSSKFSSDSEEELKILVAACLEVARGIK